MGHTSSNYFFLFSGYLVNVFAVFESKPDQCTHLVFNVVSIVMKKQQYANMSNEHEHGDFFFFIPSLIQLPRFVLGSTAHEDNGDRIYQAVPYVFEVQM